MLKLRDTKNHVLFYNQHVVQPSVQISWKYSWTTPVSIHELLKF